MDKIEKFLLDHYEFHRNSVLDRTEFRKRGSEFFKLLTERDINSIMRHLKNEDKRCTQSNLMMILNSDFVEEQDPFIRYFNALPLWDDGVDYIAELACTISTTTPALWEEYFRKWLVATVACSINPNVVNHQVLVLVGPQGKGKTSWLNRLLPKELEGYLYSGLIDPNNKDTLVQLAENFLINLDELENLNKTELGSLKSLITQSAIKLRKAYGVFNENLRRRASFMGSVNDAEFLNDTTGNRRYLCFTCEDINYLHKVNLKMVYAQAYFLYKSGKFKYHFDFEDSKKIEEINIQYLRIGTEEDLLLKYFSPATRGDANMLELTPVEILRKIEELEKGRLFDNYTSIRRIGQALQKHGFKKISKNNRKPYLLQRLTDISSDSDMEILKTTKQQKVTLEDFLYTPKAQEKFEIRGDWAKEIERFEVMPDKSKIVVNDGHSIGENGYYEVLMLLLFDQNESIKCSFICEYTDGNTNIFASNLEHIKSLKNSLLNGKELEYVISNLLELGSEISFTRENLDNLLAKSFGKGVTLLLQAKQMILLKEPIIKSN